MFQPIPTQRAHVLCEMLKTDLDVHQAMDWEGEGNISTGAMFRGSRGHMVGLLLCKDEKLDKHLLKAFSGVYDGYWEIPGWVGPCFDVQRYKAILAEYDLRIKGAEREGKESASLSLACQKELFGLYRFTGVGGRTLTIKDIFGDRLPPSGSGDCCAPKLLSECYRRGWYPVSMAEFYYGKDSPSGNRVNGVFYDPCENRCRPILDAMLGLDVIYADESICVVNKPSGLLSVPGKGPDKQDCVVNRVKALFPRSISQPSVHRLDQDTSGVLVYGLTRQAQADLSVQFAKGEVHKEYQALLEGVLKEEGGDIDVPIRPDYEHRPYQIYDPKDGKYAITHWEKMDVEKLPDGSVVTRVRFLPHTGRTHQLRVHSAFPQGLGHPIVGDRFYGHGREGQRLCLHARRLEIHHPETEKKMVFEADVPF